MLLAAGVNLPDLQVRLTIAAGRAPGSATCAPPPTVGRPGVRTHGTIALVLGAAAERWHAAGRRAASSRGRLPDAGYIAGARSS